MANGEMIYQIHIKIPLRSGKNKWPKCGAIVKLNDGALVGNIELLPAARLWDGCFVLRKPDPKPGHIPQEPEIDVDEMPV